MEDQEITINFCMQCGYETFPVNPKQKEDINMCLGNCNTEGFTVAKRKHKKRLMMMYYMNNEELGEYP